MRKALTICAAPGCSRLVRRGRCQEHARKPWAQRLSRQDRGYGAEWERLRREVLEEEDHICRYCGRPATTVDHMVPKFQGGTDDRGNLCACCRSCQASKAGREGNAGRRRIAATTVQGGRGR